MDGGERNKSDGYLKKWKREHYGLGLWVDGCVGV